MPRARVGCGARTAANNNSSPSKSSETPNPNGQLCSRAVPIRRRARSLDRATTRLMSAVPKFAARSSRGFPSASRPHTTARVASSHERLGAMSGKKETVLDLGKFIDKGVRVKLSGGREGASRSTAAVPRIHASRQRRGLSDVIGPPSRSTRIAANVGRCFETPPSARSPPLPTTPDALALSPRPRPPPPLHPPPSPPPRRQ